MPDSGANRPTPPLSPALTLVLQGQAVGALLESELAGLGLSLRKLGLLGHLQASPGISFSALARRAGIKVQSLRPITDEMAANGLVATIGTGGQGRAAKVELTAQGEAALVSAHEVLAQMDGALFAEGLWQEFGDVLTRVGTAFLKEAVSSRNSEASSGQ